MPNFETFTKRMAPLAKKPYVTIQKRGTISLNADAESLNSLHKKELIDFMNRSGDRRSAKPPIPMETASA